MAQFSALSHLISAFKTLPNVGAKTAERLAFHVLERDRLGAEQLAHALLDALARVRHCARCHTFCEGELCAVCADEGRDVRRLCVVEMPADVVSFEKTRCYDGYYFVLMGALSPLSGVGLEVFPSAALCDRVRSGGVLELIIATNYTAEGEATAHFIRQLFKDDDILITRIARGLPVGGEVALIDTGTLAQAFYERKPLS